MKYGFVMDQRKCIGCHACTVACKAEHDVPLGVFRTWVKYVEKGQFPNTRRYFGVLRCNHCDNAPCVKICPTSALFRRRDGIVDFDSALCIGCKSCMQACPYDAIYIDPESHTAAKCNFCAHRVQTGLQPACVVVCPEQAIIAGDLDSPSSEISILVSREQVSVGKPDQGTYPKLWYLGADEAVLTPGLAERGSAYLWSELLHEDGGAHTLSTPLVSVGPTLPVTRDHPIDPRGSNRGSGRLRGRLADIREVYDVYHAQPWGRRVSGYLWTKSIGAGVLVVAALLSLFGLSGGSVMNVVAPVLALLFTALTTALLVLDLKRPDRFLYVLFKGNAGSSLVIGAWILMAYSVASVLWLLSSLAGGAGMAGVAIRGLAAALGVATAGYSAFLFAQAEGRDFWQSPLLLPQLVSAAVVGGAACLLGVVAVIPRQVPLLPAADAIGVTLALSLVVTAVILFAELYTPHPNVDVGRAARLLSTGALAPVFWGGVVLLGIVLPLALLLLGGFHPSPITAVAAVGALVGLLIYEDLWLQAGQAVPLS